MFAWWAFTALAVLLAVEVHRRALIDQFEADQDRSKQEWW